MAGYSFGTTTFRQGLWYMYSQSFVTYLIREYGMEATVELIREGVDEDSYEVYPGKPFEEIKTEWLAYYEQLTPELSMEELECAYAEMYGIEIPEK